jgi:hypothetical protein
MDEKFIKENADYYCSIPMGYGLTLTIVRWIGKHYNPYFDQDKLQPARFFITELNRKYGFPCFYDRETISAREFRKQIRTIFRLCRKD